MPEADNNSQPENGEELIAVTGEKTSPEKMFFIEWGYETVKKEPERVADAAQRQVTLSAALFGGAVAVSKDAVCPYSYGWSAVTLLLLASLGVAVYGSMIRLREMNPEIPESVMAYKAAVVETRALHYSRSVRLMFAGLTVAAVVVVWKAFAG